MTFHRKKTSIFSTLLVALGFGMAITTAILATIAVPVADAKRAPELTSTALKVHKVYASSPPHDTDLYDIVGVSPNATLAQITKSYRNLSRKYHPDKQRQHSRQKNNNNPELAERKLEQLQKAYEILSDDSKRLPYHRYGLVDPNLAALLLLGPRVCPASYHQLLQQQQQPSRNVRSVDSTQQLFDRLDPELLHLMGYDDSAMDALAMAMEAAHLGHSDDPATALEEHRVRTVAALLLESIRPVVEGRLDSRLYAHMLAQDCDRWKRLPLGAQIIRSVGRAYRHEGSEFLQRSKHAFGGSNTRGAWHGSENHDGYGGSRSIPKGTSGKQMVLQLTDLKIGFRRRWRSTKDFLEAATVSGRLAMAERSFNQQEKKLRLQQQEKEQRKRETLERIEYRGSDPEPTSGFLPRMDDYQYLDDDADAYAFDDHDYESLEELEEEQKELEQLQARQTLLQTLQIEALWKVCKIDLDRVVRKACATILSGEYFFYPSHQSSHGAPIHGGTSGWVASSGRTIDSEQARIAAAEVMKMTGEIMVQQSKEGTSWKQ